LNDTPFLEGRSEEFRDLVNGSVYPH